MQFRISYNEMQQVAAEKTGQSISIAYGDPCSVIFSFKKLVTMSLRLTVERVLGGDVRIVYSGSMGVEPMVKMALAKLKSMPQGAMIETLDDNRVVVHLGMNPQISQILEHVILQDISFDPEFVIIEFVKRP